MILDCSDSLHCPMSWDCSLIRSRLYLGGISCALDPGVPFALGVRSILSLTDATAAEQVRSVQAVACSEIVFKHVDLEDSSDADLLSHLEECTNFVATGLATSRGSVLVHWYGLLNPVRIGTLPLNITCIALPGFHVVQPWLLRTS